VAARTAALLEGDHAEAWKRARRLLQMAIAGSQRHPRIPDVPTMAEAGFPDVQMQQWFGLFAPAGTPQPVVRILNAAFVRALENDDVKAKLEPQVSFLIPGTPEDLSAMVTRDIVRLGAVVKESGAQVSQ